MDNGSKLYRLFFWHCRDSSQMDALQSTASMQSITDERAGERGMQENE